MSKKNTEVKYDCSKCPGYCCSYPRIIVTKEDIERLAGHFNVSFDEAKKRFTQAYRYESKEEKIKEQILRHRKDDV